MPELDPLPHPRQQDVPLRYGLLLFPQWELLDAAGPLECLNCLAHSPDFPWAGDLDLAIIAETLEPVSTGPLKGDPKPFNARVSQSIVPTCTFEDCGEIDVLIIPGGYGAGPKTASGFEPDVEKVVDFIARMYEKVENIITVCTGSGLAARAGILDGHRATTNKQAWDWITPTGPRTHWIAKARWVSTDNGKIYTSSGVSAGTDCFLSFIEEEYGTDDKGVSWADRVASGMEWIRVRDWKEDVFAKETGVVDVEAKE